MTELYAIIRVRGMAECCTESFGLRHVLAKPDTPHSDAASVVGDSL